MAANKVLFKKRLLDLGMTQTEFCKQKGINNGGLSNAFSGKGYINDKLKVVIAMELGLDPTELWGLDPKEVYHPREVEYIKKLIKEGVL